MRPFRLKKTITQATVLSALLPSAVVLSQPVHAPVGLNGKIVIAAGSTAVIAHEVIPAGLAPMDPKAAPARGGYVYDNFDTVVRTGVTGECVKHGLWSPEIATPNCEPWLFAKPVAAPAAPKAEAKPAPEPAPAPKAEAKPAPKDAGFPEWMGPGEANMGIAPIWPQSNLEPEDNIGLPRMYFGADDAGHEPQSDDLISDPVLYSGADELDAGGADLVGAPVMHDSGEDHAVGGADLISAPRLYGDTAAAPDGGWPGDPYAEAHPAEEAAATGSNDSWMLAPREDKAAAAPSTMMDYKQEESWPSDPYAISHATEDGSAVGSNDNWMPTPKGGTAAAAASGMPDFKEEWPADKYAQGFVEDKPVMASDSSWVIPNPISEGPVDPMIGHYREDGTEPEEGIGQSVMHYDDGDSGADPSETISLPIMNYGDGTGDGASVTDDSITGHRMALADGSDDGAAGTDDLITGHRMYHGDDGDGTANDDGLISAPRLGKDEPTAAAASPYGAAFNERPFPEVAAADEPESKPFNAEFPAAVAAAPAAAAPTAARLAAEADAEEEEDEAGEYEPDYSSTLAAKDAFADLPVGKTKSAGPTAAAAVAPAYASNEPEEDEEPEEAFVPDYSSVATAKGARDNLPYPAAKPAPAAPSKPAPAPAKDAAPEEHLMTVVLSADTLFDFDRYVMKPGARKSLDEFVAAVKQIKWDVIQVVGHTDRLGSDKYNQRLSERRAHAVRKLLVARGLDGRKIKAIGKGKAQPITTDCVGEKRSKELIACLQPDRRVEILVDEKRDVKITKPAKPK